MAITNYKVQAGIDAAQLTSLVTTDIASGWEPIGGCYSAGNYTFQALTKGVHSNASTENYAALTNTGTLAATGSASSDAAVIVDKYTVVTGADGTKGVALPAAAVDTSYYVINSDGSSLLKVYPVDGGNDDINGGSEDASVSLMPGQAAWFVCVNGTDWYCELQSLVTAGTVAANRAVVVDTNKDASAFRNVTVTNLDAGASGTAGTVDVFPSTASKGKLAITCTDQTGDTTVSLVAGAMAAARTITIRDPGAAASLLTTTDGTAAATTSTAVELTRAADVSTRSVAAGGTLAVTEAAHEGRTILLDTASGSVCTLPAPVVGMRIRFLVSVAVTSNFHQVKVAAGTDFLGGLVNILDNDGTTISAFRADPTSDDNIQLNGTTKGGVIGDWLEFEGITSTIWAVTGQLTCPAGSNPADPFSAAV